MAVVQGYYLKQSKENHLDLRMISTVTQPGSESCATKVLRTPSSKAYDLYPPVDARFVRAQEEEEAGIFILRSKDSATQF